MNLTFKQANLMLREKKYTEAVDIYKKIIHENPFIKKYIEFNINFIVKKNINKMRIQARSATLNN